MCKITEQVCLDVWQMVETRRAIGRFEFLMTVVMVVVVVRVVSVIVVTAGGVRINRRLSI